jgi:hypothetical protein
VNLGELYKKYEERLRREKRGTADDAIRNQAEDDAAKAYKERVSEYEQLLDNALDGVEIEDHDALRDALERVIAYLPPTTQ